MTVEVKPEHERFIEEAIRDGRFGSFDDLFNCALSALRQSSISTAPRSPRPNLADFLRNSPFAGAALDLERHKDYPRLVDLLTGIFWWIASVEPRQGVGNGNRTPLHRPRYSSLPPSGIVASSYSPASYASRAILSSADLRAPDRRLA